MPTCLEVPPSTTGPASKIRHRRVLAALSLVVIGSLLWGAAALGREVIRDPTVLGRRGYAEFLRRHGALVDPGPRWRLQTTLSDCGVAVVVEALRERGRDIPDRGKLATRLGLDPTGVALPAIGRVLDELGIATIRMNGPRQGVPAPMTIALLSYRHYVLVREVRGDTVRAFDPMLGDVRFPVEFFGKYWTGSGIRLVAIDRRVDAHPE